MFKDESLNLSGVWRGLAGVINLCPNCYQRVEATAWGSMQIQQNEKKQQQQAFDLVRGIICFCADAFPDWHKWVRSFTFQCKTPDCCHLFLGGWGGRRVNFKPPLSIVGSVSACFGNIPCKLCTQGFTVHVHTVRVHTNTNSYLCSSPAQGIYIKIKWNEKWN